MIDIKTAALYFVCRKHSSKASENKLNFRSKLLRSEKVGFQFASNGAFNIYLRLV